MPKNRSTQMRLFWIAVLSVLAATWAVFAYVLVPWIIVRAYRGESLTSFDHLIRGQANHPVAEYLTRWDLWAGKLSLALTVLGVYIGLAVIGLTGAAKIEASEPAEKVAMPRRRLWVVYALGLVIIGGLLCDLARDTEHWPFSPFPMFSEISLGKTYSTLRLYGVVQQSPLIEIQLDNNLYVQPFDNSRLGDALAHARQENRLDEAVTDCLARYEALRRAGRHAGPRLVAMRLYEVTWTLDPEASNIDRPDRKELLIEVIHRNESGD